MPVSFSKQPGIPGKNHRTVFPKWIFLREEYIRRNVGGDAVTLADFAKENNLKYGTVQQQAFRHRWTAELEDRLARTTRTVTEELAKRSVEAIDTLRGRLAETEADVRMRHVKIARKMQLKALTFIDAGNYEMTVRDAIDIMRIFAIEERKGLGLPEVYVSQTVNYNSLLSKAQQVFEAHLRTKGAAALAVSKALRVIEGDFESVDDNASTPPNPA